MKEFAELHEVKQICHSLFISSASTDYSGNLKYKDSRDSTTVHYNNVDETIFRCTTIRWLPEEIFSTSVSENARGPEVIINERAIKWMKHTSMIAIPAAWLFFDQVAFQGLFIVYLSGSWTF
jgi:hypothetical protein